MSDAQPDPLRLEFTVDDKGRVEVSKLNKSFDETEKKAREGKKSVKNFGDQTAKSGKSAKEAGKDVNSLAKSLKSIASFKNMVVGSVVVVGAGAAIRQYAQYDRAVREVATLTGMTEAEIAALSGRIKEMANEFGQLPVNTAKAFYSTHSAGFTDVARSQTLMTQANRLAIAGVTDVNTAMEAIIATLQPYEMGVDKAAHVSNVLFATVRAGITTIPELSSALSGVTGSAASAGVEVEELMGMIASMTAISKASTGDVTTQINAILKAAMMVGDRVKAINQEYGLAIDFSPAAIENDGLMKVLVQTREELDKIIDTNARAAATFEIFSRSEAFRGFQFATNATTQEMFGAFSSQEFETIVDDAMAIIERSASHRLAKFKTSLSTTVIEAGGLLWDVFGEDIDELRDTFLSISKYIGDNREEWGDWLDGVWDSTKTVIVWIGREVMIILDAVMTTIDSVGAFFANWDGDIFKIDDALAKVKADPKSIYNFSRPPSDLSTERKNQLIDELYPDQIEKLNSTLYEDSLWRNRHKIIPPEFYFEKGWIKGREKYDEAVERELLALQKYTPNNEILRTVTNWFDEVFNSASNKISEAQAYSAAKSGIPQSDKETATINLAKALMGAENLTKEERDRLDISDKAFRQMREQHFALSERLELLQRSKGLENDSLELIRLQGEFRQRELDHQEELIREIENEAEMKGNLINLELQRKIVNEEITAEIRAQKQATIESLDALVSRTAGVGEVQKGRFGGLLGSSFEAVELFEGIKKLKSERDKLLESIPKDFENILGQTNFLNDLQSDDIYGPLPPDALDLAEQQLAVFRDTYLNHTKELEDIDRSSAQARLAITSTMFSGLGSVLEDYMELTGDKSKEMLIARKAVAMAQASVNTALAITEVLAATAITGPGAIALASVIGAIGAAQVGLIAATPTYHDGGYVAARGRLKPDEIQATLQTGEYVVSRRGVAALDAINRGDVPQPTPSGSGGVDRAIIMSEEDIESFLLNSSRGRAAVRQIMIEENYNAA